MKRVLIYSHDTFGLGNIRRMLEIARHLVATSDRVSVLVITGSPMLHAFRIPAGVDYVKLPCLSRNVAGQYAARSLKLSLSSTVQLRANIIQSAIADFNPDLILVDKKPFGVEDELASALTVQSAHMRRPKVVLLLRDILDSPETTGHVWRKNGYFDAINVYYDQVLVVGSPHVFDLRHEYAMPANAASKVKFCGYIARQPGRQSATQVRDSLGLREQEPLVLVTTGGGEDGYSLIDACLTGLRQMNSSARPRTHIICGPEMAEAQRDALVSSAASLPNVSMQEFSDDMMSMMAAADVVLAMGGYNTVCELLTLNKRSVVVPRTKPVQEQWIRADRMASLGLLHMIHPDELNPSSLWRALQAELAEIAPRPKLDTMQGLEQVTAEILGAIGLEESALRLGRAAPFASRGARQSEQLNKDTKWSIQA